MRVLCDEQGAAFRRDGVLVVSDAISSELQASLRGAFDVHRAAGSASERGA